MEKNWLTQLGSRLFGSGQHAVNFIYQLLPYTYQDSNGKSVRFDPGEPPGNGVRIRITEVNGGITEITIPEAEFQRVLDDFGNQTTD